MEHNSAYGLIDERIEDTPADNNISYNTVDHGTISRNQTSRYSNPGERQENTYDEIVNKFKAPAEDSLKKSQVLICSAATSALVISVLSLLVAVAALVFFNSELRNQLCSATCNQSLNQQLLFTQLNDSIAKIESIIGELSPTAFFPGSLTNPASSCSDIPQDRPPGEYWIQANNTISPVQVFCDMERTSCSCNRTTKGWMRVANLDMTDPNQTCPTAFSLRTRTTPPLRTCGRSVFGCTRAIFPTFGIEYSHVCGRIVAYQDGSPDGFFSSNSLTIDDTYVDGISVTHGQSPRQHIWTFAAALDELSSTCPCINSEIETGFAPSFINQDYFCDTGSRDRFQHIFYPDDPLWDGQGCGRASTCCQFNNPPWFCKQLPQPTTDDIELRMCFGSGVTDEDTPLELIQLFIN
ncbi:uncharacterized protein LOC135341148 [Halichondria panicea]|uniref:uncharacterized protein LOC135341148 n=1 Tax=Halichondria panicea TaxID=6063 RepID=UPI00312B3218